MKKKIIISVSIVVVVFYFLLIFPLKYTVSFLGFSTDIKLRYEPLNCRMVISLGALNYNIDNINWFQAIEIRYKLITGDLDTLDAPKQIEKKVVKDELLANANIHYAIFKEAQKKYSLNFWKLNKEQKDEVFSMLYKGFMEEYSRFCLFYENYNIPLSPTYVKMHKDEYQKIGIGFVKIENEYNIVPDYSVIIKTFGIPDAWKKWLKLQDKYTKERAHACNNSICEGESLSMDKMEQAIVEFEEVENESKEIKKINAAEFDYIPDTSISLLDTFLLGNELYWHFDFGDTEKIMPDSKRCYEHFIEVHKNSKYYNLINEYYTKLKANNFKYSEKTKEWLYQNIQSLQ